MITGLPTTNISPAVTSVQFQSSGCSTSVLYQSTVTPTFYTSTGSPFHSTGAFLPPAVEDRKEYVCSENAVFDIYSIMQYSMKDCFPILCFSDFKDF